MLAYGILHVLVKQRSKTFQYMSDTFQAHLVLQL